MTYFKSVQPKLALQLKHNAYNSNVTNYLVHCCHFHGCGGIPACASLTSAWNEFHRNHTKPKSLDALSIFHYGRSLEKFGLKAKTWQTAGGRDNSYHLEHFLDRNVGHHLDSRMLRYTCQLRQHLIDKTGQNPYFRSGDYWFRNVEFGRPLLDGAKGRRNGGPVTDGYTFRGRVLDHYFGYYTTLDQYRKNIKHRERHRE